MVSIIAFLTFQQFQVLQLKEKESLWGVRPWSTLNWVKKLVLELLGKFLFYPAKFLPLYA